MGAYIWWWRVSLEIRFDGFVLFVEVRKIGYEIFDDVGVRERINARFLCGVGRDTAYEIITLVKTILHA